MSKITPKNLSYDSTLPPFLARLQSHNSSLNDRHEFHAARPKKPRDAEADKEDEPVYFDEESGETLTKGEWEEREKFAEETVETEDGKEEKGKEGEGELREVKEKEKAKVAAIGGGRKRKAGKVIGGDEEEAEAVVIKKVLTDKAPASKSEGKKVEKGGKTVKKGKKIKLSFGDDE